jgi:hypothetical protein
VQLAGMLPSGHDLKGHVFAVNLNSGVLELRPIRRLCRTASSRAVRVERARLRRSNLNADTQLRRTISKRRDTDAERNFVCRQRVPAARGTAEIAR